MDQWGRQFLTDIVNAVSPTGYEHGAQAVYRRYMSEISDAVRTDSHRNVIAVLNPEGSPRIMLAGHCDELGFQIHFVDDDGFLYFLPLGGHDEGIVPGRRVTIHTKNGPVYGVIGKKPIHLMTEEERKAPSEIKKLWIDIGAGSKKRSLELVQIGDPVTYNETLTELQGGMATARGFDDKIGVFAVGYALRLLNDAGPLEAAVFAASTVQEEIGMRGARTAAFGIDPAVGLAVDVTFATDYPGIEKKEHGEIKVGAGPVIARGPNISPKVFQRLTQVAEQQKIPYQIEAVNRGTGTDANVIQLTRSGVATGLLSVPNRYMHTPAELVSLEDACNTAGLLAAFCRSVKVADDWTLA